MRLVALTAAHPERPFQAITVGRRQSQASVSRIGPLGDDAASRHASALEYLAVLADLMDRGLREPLPIACKTSHAYADAANKGFDPPRWAVREWASEFRFDKEDREPEHLLAFGGQQPLGFLLAPPTRADERDWHTTDGTRFGVFARRLWAGVFAHEKVETR